MFVMVSYNLPLGLRFSLLLNVLESFSFSFNLYPRFPIWDNRIKDHSNSSIFDKIKDTRAHSEIFKICLRLQVIASVNSVTYNK